MKAGGLIIAVALLGSMPSAMAQEVPKLPVLASYGACLIQRSPEVAARALGAPLSSAAERAAVQALTRSNPDCWTSPRRLSLRTGEVRGALAAARFASDPALLAAEANFAKAPAVRPEPTKGRALVAAMSTCIERADPAGVAALIATEGGSEGEVAALSSLQPTIDQCTPIGAQVESMADLRNHLAAVAYVRASGVSMQEAVE